MKNEKKLPQSMLEMPQMPVSPVYEMREGRLIVKFEEDAPTVRVGMNSFAITEGPSIVIGSRKHIITEVC